jgi:hypothetical protein
MIEPTKPPTAEFVEYLNWLAGFVKRVEALADEAHARQECGMEVPLRALALSIAAGQRDFFALLSQFTVDVITGKAPEDLKRLVGILASGGFVKCEVMVGDAPTPALPMKANEKPN